MDDPSVAQSTLKFSITQPPLLVKMAVRLVLVISWMIGRLALLSHTPGALCLMSPLVVLYPIKRFGIVALVTTACGAANVNVAFV
jgi:hypothetical protein